MPLAEAHALSFDAIERALRLAPESGLAHNAMAWMQYRYKNDLESAAAHFERAMELDPTNTDIVGNVSMFLNALGRSEESIRFGEYQVSRDPANAIAHNNLGIRYRNNGQFVKAEEAFSTTLMLNPEFGGAYYELGASRLGNGDYAGAASAFESETIEVFSKIGLAMTNYAKGDLALSNELLIELIQTYGDRIAYYVAQIMAFRSEADDAFQWLDKAKRAGDRELSVVMNEPLFANLHNDPRWYPFLESIGKSPNQLEAIKFDVSLLE